MQEIIDEQGLTDIAGLIAQAVINHHNDGWIFYLYGDLGTGKTTFVRAFLRALSYLGTVKSPTFTLVEPYHLNLNKDQVNLYHFDLYRLSNPLELDEMGIEDYFADNAIVFVEWPDQGAGILPVSDMEIHLKHYHQRREILIKVNNSRAEELLAMALNQHS